MSKRSVFAMVLMVLVGIALSGCVVTCDPGSLLQPDLVSPNWREVVDGTSATLEWSYPDTCEPEEFEIILSKDREYAVIELTHLVPGDSTTWTPPTLDTAEEYWWRVRAKVDTSFGGYSGERRSFFTLPYCTSSQLVAPNLVSPAFGAIYDNDYDSLEWSWPLDGTCIPESYRVEVSPGSPAFTDTTYNGGTGTPGTRWGFGSTPPVATQFWWRITAFSDGVWGPASMHKMFWTAPACTAASLVAPTAETPGNGDIIAIPNPILTWSYPHTTCTPEGQHVWISETPDMSSIVFDSSSPTLAAREMQASVTLNDCTTYYWQVAMISEGVEGPPSLIRGFAVDLTGSCSCDPASLPIPTLVLPAPYEILPDQLPFLQWSTAGGCIPDGTNIDLNRFHDFSGPALGGTASGPTASWSPSSLLEPATQYWWRALSNGGAGQSDPSSKRSFFTGPECTSPAEVVAPVRLEPADGSVVNTLTPTLKYTTGIPGCIPDGYLLHLHEMADFSDPNLLTEYTLPATTMLTDPLTDCQEYHWSVTAVQDGGYGPESDHGSFFVDVDGTCGFGGIPGAAKSNNFCRESTFASSAKFATHLAGDKVLAIARNPFSTYLLFNILDQETGKPFKNEIHCWSFKDNFILERPIEELKVVVPAPEEVPEPLVCAEDTGPVACRKFGGKHDGTICHCP